MNKSSIRFAGLVWLLLVLVSCGGGGESSAGSTTVNNSSGNDTPVVDPDPDSDPVSVGSIESVVLVDGSDLSEIVTIESGASLNISQLPDTFNFVANPSDENSTGSVAIEVTGCVDIDRTENVAPYTVQAEGMGFDSDDFAAIDETTCSIDLTPYELDDEQGEEGPTLQMSITVVNDGAEEPVDPPAGTPVVELLGDETVFLAQGAEYNELGATASDAEDGDISDDIVIGGDQVNTLIVATYILSYAVTDSSGATATAYRTVEVQGNQPPEISIVGSETIYVNLNETYVDQGAEAADLEDDDVELTAQMTAGSNVDTSAIGEYQVVYSVTDSNGDSDTAVRTVIVTTGQASSDIDAVILSRTRVNGVSPETIYFSAEESACSDCVDIWGLNTTIADAYSVLSYHFNFDDSDSGSFDTTGNSRNQQVGPSPRAAHTFHCEGESDANWDSSDQRCEFDVGVRVQSIDGDYGDAYIRVNIQPTHGVGGYYADEDIYCVSTTSDYSSCPHSNSSRHLDNTPSSGNNNFHESLVLFHNNGATYDSVCVGADEYNVRVGSYGSGSSAVIPKINSSGNPSNPCTGSFNSDSNISGVNMIAKDADGHVTQGFGFNQVFFDLRVGEVDVGETSALNQFHNLDMDWSETGTYNSYFSPANGADGCIEDSRLDCDNLHYPYGLALTDSVLAGNDSNLPGVNFFAANGGSLVDAMILGTSMNRAVEHNIRVMGAWGMIVANNWLKGNHVSSGGNGGGGGKHRLTIRAASATGVQTDIDKNPEDFSSNDYIRGSSDEAEFLNQFNIVVDNWFNQDGDGQDPEHVSASWAHLFSHWMIVADNTYIPDGESSGTAQQVGGSYIVSRTEPEDWPSGHTTALCTLINGGGYSDDTEYLDSSTIHYEEDIEGPCGSIGDTNFGLLPSLLSPAAPEI